MSLVYFFSERSTRTVMRYFPFGCSVMEENLIDLLWPRKRPRHRRRSLLRRALSDPVLRSALLRSPRLFWSLHPTPVTQRSFFGERNVQGKWILQSYALFAFLSSLAYSLCHTSMNFSNTCLILTTTTNTPHGSTEHGARDDVSDTF